MEHQYAIFAVAGLDGEDVLLLGYASEVIDELHPRTVIEGVDNKLGRATCQVATTISNRSDVRHLSWTLSGPSRQAMS